MSTIGYVVRGLPRTYAELYRSLNRVTLGVLPLFGSFMVFWLVPGSALFDSARALRRGEAAPAVSRAALVTSWAFVPVVVAWTAWRRWYA